MAPGNGPNRDPVEEETEALDAAAGAAGLGVASSGSQATALENQLVARAWIATSEDAKVSTDQTGEHFHVSFAKTYWTMAKNYVQAKRRGWEKISLNRGETFPRTQFVKIRQATYLILAVRKQFPRTSGDNNKPEWYARIRPFIKEKFKPKRLPVTKIERFEIVADYLMDKPKFMTHMQDEFINRPKGKRAAQQQTLIENARKKVMESEGVADGNVSVLDGGVATAQGITAMSQMLHRVVQQNTQLMHSAMYQQQLAQQNQMRALVLALNPSAVSVFDQSLAIAPLPPVAPLPTGPRRNAASSRNSESSSAVDQAAEVVRQATSNSNNNSSGSGSGSASADNNNSNNNNNNNDLETSEEES